MTRRAILGPWLEQLSPEAEDALLTLPMGQLRSLGGPGCLVEVASGGVALDYGKFRDTQRPTPPAGWEIESHYDMLAWRLGGHYRVATMIRARILRNRLQRALRGIPAVQEVAV